MNYYVASGGLGDGVCASPIPLQLRELARHQLGQPPSAACSKIASNSLQDNQRQQTVYTVRFTTAFARGSGLDEPYAGVQLCLIGADGSSVLHRVSPLFDPAALQAELASINAVRPHPESLTQFSPLLLHLCLQCSTWL